MALGFRGFNRGKISEQKLPENMPPFAVNSGWTTSSHAQGYARLGDYEQYKQLNVDAGGSAYSRMDVRIYSPWFEVGSAKKVTVSYICSAYGAPVYDRYLVLFATKDKQTSDNLGGYSVGEEWGNVSNSGSFTIDVKGYKYISLQGKLHVQGSGSTAGSGYLRITGISFLKN